MLWNNNTLINFIKDRSMLVNRSLLPRRPTSPENNQLFKERISKEAILLREELDNIQGSDRDNTLAGQIVNAITLSGSVKPIPKDHCYTNEEIGEYLKYLNSVEEWNEIVMQIQNTENYKPYSEIDNIPIMSVLYTTEKDNNILVMSSDDIYIRELSTNSMDNVIGGRYTNQMSYFYEVKLEELDEFLSDIDFEELRKRLINAGYTSFVEEVNKHLKDF